MLIEHSTIEGRADLAGSVAVQQAVVRGLPAGAPVEVGGHSVVEAPG